VVRLDVREDVALKRVATRERNRHLSDDADVNRAVWRAFYRDVEPNRRADLVIDTAQMSPRDAARAIANTVGFRPRS
jgi:hypothetical protein